MARPKRDGLLYFSLDTDFFYADRRIKALRSRYGSDGLIFYIYLLTEIYRNGYYIRWDEDGMDNAIVDLGLTEGLIEQVMTFLVNRSLLTRILVDSDTIVTSPGIQRRYQEAVKGLKREIPVDGMIWLLQEDETAAYIKITKNPSFSGKNDNKSGINESKSKENPINEMKQNEMKSKEIEGAGGKTGGIECFEQFWAAYPTKQARALAEREYIQLVISGTPEGELVQVAKNYAEACRIKRTAEQFVKHANNFLRDGTWADYAPGKYKPPEPQTKAAAAKGNNRFNNFSQRSYDYESLERQLLGGGDHG